MQSATRGNHRAAFLYLDTPKRFNLMIGNQQQMKVIQDSYRE